MTRRLTFWTALLAVTVPLAAGCSNPEPEKSAEATPAEAASPASEASPSSEASPAAGTVAGPPAPDKVDTSPQLGPKAVKTASGLQYEDMKVGTGAEAVTGKKVLVHYTGALTNGTKFDSSRDRGQPFDFDLGAGRVIKGWDEGVAGMKVGGRRKLVIPGDLAYGPSGTPDGTIPPNSTLVFDVELIEVQ